ncbi:MAG: hypothetical protein IJB76_05195 [Clostridia bacterium]|nr:hypothetical protein [Clostridia bacterium]
MAKKKLIPTWLKIAAVAALFVPYEVKCEKDEGKLKKLSLRSLAAHVSYVPKTDDKDADIWVQFPGYKAFDDFDCEEFEEDEFDCEEILEDSALVNDELFDENDTLSDIEKEFSAE